MRLKGAELKLSDGDKKENKINKNTNYPYEQSRPCEEGSENEF